MEDSNDEQLNFPPSPEEGGQRLPYLLSWILRLGCVTWISLGGVIGLIVHECLKGSESGEAWLRGMVITLTVTALVLFVVLHIVPRRFYGDVMSRYEHLYIAQSERIKDAPWFEFYPRYTSGISKQLKVLGVIYVVSYALWCSVMGAFLVIITR